MVGQVFISTIPKDEDGDEGSSASVVQKVGREVLITITDQEIIGFETTIIPDYDIEKDGTLKIRIIYENLGNIFIKPDTQLTIKKGGKTIFNAIFPYPANEEAVKPRIKKEITPIEWQSTGQVEGRYLAEVKILHNGQTMEEDDFPFVVGMGIRDVIRGGRSRRGHCPGSGPVHFLNHLFLR